MTSRRRMLLVLGATAMALLGASGVARATGTAEPAVPDGAAPALGTPTPCGAPEPSDPSGAVKSFESGDFSRWFEELAGAYSGQVVSEPVRCGSHAARFELRQGDVAGPVGGQRSELHEILDYMAPSGSTVWYGFSTLIPPDWPALDRGAVITQWHATPDLADGEVWRSPPLAVRYSGTNLEVTGRHSSEPIQDANDGEHLELYSHPETFERGVWHDWVFQVRWDHTDAGFVRAWLDGELVVEYSGPIGYNDEYGVWFKWGIYRGHNDEPETVVLFHDEYRRSEDCADVAPHLCGDDPDPVTVPSALAPSQDPDAVDDEAPAGPGVSPAPPATSRSAAPSFTG